MQNFVKGVTTFVLGLAFVLAGLPTTTVAQNAGVIAAVLNKMESNYKNLKSLRAAISMEKWDNTIKKADKVGGWVLYLPAKGKNANIRVDWTTPVQETLSVADGQYLLCKHRIKTCYEGKNQKVKQQSGAMNFLSMSSTELKSSFDFKDAYDETLWGGVATTHFTLSPKTKQDFKYAEVWVDGSGMPVQSKVVEYNGDATTIRLMNIDKNIQLSLEQIKITPPSGYKRVKA
jgi:outer membrane lipoprotein-sorting protein